MQQTNLSHASAKPCPHTKAMTAVFYKTSERPEISLSKSKAGEAAQPIRLEYLNEGNANVIYRIASFEHDEILPEALRGRLLRLRKDKPFIRTTLEQHEAFATEFKPLFAVDSLVEHKLVPVRCEVTQSLNVLLHQLEHSGRRPVSRHGDALATDETYGTLMTDMTPSTWAISFELKPKWLVQSPDAPRNAVRCRTCALRAQRCRTQGEREAYKDPTAFCPLALTSPMYRERRKVFAMLAYGDRQRFSESEDQVIHHLAKDILPVLSELRAFQAKFGIQSILRYKLGDPISNDYLKAMTLRDCTLLVKGNTQGAVPTFQARLADLDLKQAHPDKFLYWQQTEKALINEGWYTNTEVNAVPEEVCLLSCYRSN